MTPPKKAENGKTPVTSEKIEEVTAETTEVTVLENPETNALKFVGRKTASDVFEKLEQGNRMREGFNRFKEKLEVCEKFAGGYNNEALSMSIQNVGTGEEIQIQSISLILEFVNEKVIKAGRSHLKHLEDEIVNFAL